MPLTKRQVLQMKRDNRDGGIGLSPDECDKLIDEVIRLQAIESLVSSGSDKLSQGIEGLNKVRRERTRGNGRKERS